MDHQSIFSLDHLAPLLEIDDGMTGIDPTRHLWSIMSTTIHEVYHFNRSIASTEAPEPAWFVARRARLDQLLQTVDVLSHAIHSTTRQEDGRVTSSRARTLLRSLACIELCCVEHSVLLAVIAFRKGEPYSQQITYSRVFADLDRICRTVSLFVCDSPIEYGYR